MMWYGHADDISVESSQCKHAPARRDRGLQIPWIERTQRHEDGIEGHSKRDFNQGNMVE